MTQRSVCVSIRAATRSSWSRFATRTAGHSWSQRVGVRRPPQRSNTRKHNVPRNAPSVHRSNIRGGRRRNCPDVAEALRTYKRPYRVLEHHGRAFGNHLLGGRSHEHQSVGPDHQRAPRLHSRVRPRPRRWPKASTRCHHGRECTPTRSRHRHQPGWRGLGNARVRRWAARRGCPDRRRDVQERSKPLVHGTEETAHLGCTRWAVSFVRCPRCSMNVWTWVIVVRFGLVLAVSTLWVEAANMLG